MIKKPTLQDAEEIYRSLRDVPRMNVNQRILGNIDEATKILKAEINEFSPELAAVRQTASNTRSGRDAYEYGTKILSKNPEEIAVQLEQLANVPGAIEALRQGFMTTYKARTGSSTAAIKNVAEEGKKFNEIVRMLFPMGNQADDIIGKAQIAGAALDVYEEEPKLAPGLNKLDNVVLTAHIASATLWTRGAMSEIAAKNVLAILAGKKGSNQVN